MTLIALQTPGCYEIQFPSSTDLRGVFVKNYREDWFQTVSHSVHFVEEYFTISRHGVLRGLHFQRPPHDLAKMVYCLRGEVMDVIVDLRRGSPRYGKYEILTLNELNHSGIYLAPGIAHGFFVTGQEAILQYKVTSYYDQAADDGIRWDSVGVPWPDERPVISDRDLQFVALADFDSPFLFEQFEDV